MTSSDRPQHIASSDGVSVALHDLGGDGPPLVFVHATGFHGRCYRRIAERLSDVRHCVAPDLRGHGNSTTPTNGRFAWAGMVDDLCAVLDALGIDEPIDFVGHSMGGATVLGTELRRPGSVRKAWLFEPIVFPDIGERGPSPLVEGARKRRAVFDSFDAAIDRYGSRPPFDAIDPLVLDDYVRFGFHPGGDGVTLKCAPESEAATFENTDSTLFGRISAITADIRVIGSSDGDAPADFAPIAAAQMPGADYSCWEGETHFGPFAEPRRAADEIRSFIED